ncbi:MAG TPA: nodulation protein NfeD [Bacteroidota bacterium]|nr:nodulation protein NfeD [Bacteroidota bacterium]
MRVVFLISLISVFFSAPVSPAAATGKVTLITVETAINPSTADFIHQSIADAGENGSVAIVIRLNTPGGLLKSTRNIVSDLLEAPIPVIVYVSPGGAQAASAGVFITLAAHIAAMSPGTNIGAAHPVSVGSEMDSVMTEKMTNDAAAFIRSISEKRHRNVRWAEESVRNSISITEAEALKEGVIDLVAADLPSLFSGLEGKVVSVRGVADTLRLSGAFVVEVKKSFQQDILDIVSDPNIAYIFMMLGIYGLMFELYNPGSIFPGVVGVISLILAFYSLHTLPVNYAGVGLIAFSVILFLLEIKIVSHGLLSIGGIISLAMGSIMLFKSDSLLEAVAVSWEVILTSVAVTAIFFLFVIGMGLKAQRRKPTTGSAGIVGEEGVALTALSPEGRVKVHGEIWSAVTSGEAVAPGEAVIVEKSANLKLIVKKKNA